MGTRLSVFFLDSSKSISIKRQISYRQFASQEAFYLRARARGALQLFNITWDENPYEGESLCKFQEIKSAIICVKLYF